MPRLQHFDNLGTARFITFSCFQRYPYLNRAAARNIVVEELESLRAGKEIRLLAWVLMPDHVHLVLWPRKSVKLGRTIGQFKARTALRILPLYPEREHRRRSNGQSAVWQRRCYDHNCRSAETVREKVDYCHRNPVTAGIVARPEDWPWSSYRFYSEQGHALIEIDAIDL